MSERLPVGEVLNEAFQFGLKRWTSVLKYGWLPALLAIGVMGGFAYLIFDMTALRAAENDPTVFLRFDEFLRAPPGVAIVLGVLAFVVILFLFSGFMASVYRLVALGEEREGIIQLRVNGPATRVFFALIILTVINYGIWFVAFVIAAAMSGATPGAVLSAAAQSFVKIMAAAEADTTIAPEQLVVLAEPFGVFVLATVLAVVPLVYLSIKLVPFPAGSAAEDRLLLFGAFRMTAGHFWSILGAYFLLMLLLMVLGVVFGLGMEVLDLLAGLNAGGSTGLTLVATAAFIVQLALTIVYQAFVYGVQFALQAIVYRRLTTGA